MTQVQNVASTLFLAIFALACTDPGSANSRSGSTDSLTATQDTDQHDVDLQVDDTPSSITDGAGLEAAADSQVPEVIPAALSSGRHLLGVAIVVDPSKPLRFQLVLAVDSGSFMVSAELQGLASPPNNGAVSPGTPVGDVYSDSTGIDAEGGLVLDFGSVVLPSEANPILPTAMKMTLALVGSCQGDGSCCGLVAGNVTSPAALPLEGSTWALVPWPEGLDASSIDTSTACSSEP